MDLSEMENLLTRRLGRDVQSVVMGYYRPQYEAACRLVGALAASIRGDWSEGVSGRIGDIVDLCNEYKIPRNEIDEEAVSYDGRWFRDCWEGPYGAPVYRADLKLLGYKKWCLGHYWDSYVE